MGWQLTHLVLLDLAINDELTTYLPKNMLLWAINHCACRVLRAVLGRES